MPNFIESKVTFCGRTYVHVRTYACAYVHTHGRTFETGFIRSTVSKGRPNKSLLYIHTLKQRSSYPSSVQLKQSSERLLTRTLDPHLPKLMHWNVIITSVNVSTGTVILQVFTNELQHKPAVYPNIPNYAHNVSFSFIPQQKTWCFLMKPMQTKLIHIVTHFIEQQDDYRLCIFWLVTWHIHRNS